jgi:glycosyltransferase involved in cell wall biosynthesis
MINIIHTITTLSNSAGGPSFFLSELVNELNKNNNLICSNDVISYNTNDNIITFNRNPTYIKSIIPKIYYNKNMFSNCLIKQNTIIHHHGLWQYPMISSYKYSIRNKIPFIISPHGMLEPWSLKQNKLIKKFARYIYQDNILKNSIYIHATSIMEARNIKKLGFNNINIIPNGMNTDIYFYKKPNNYLFSKKKLLFLSRIHQKKGIEILIKAFALLDINLKNEYTISIVGQGDRNYINSLINLIKYYSLENCIKIFDPIYDLKNKVSLIQDSYITILPSFSENFGNIIAESISCGTPVITTNTTPWEILNDTNSGWCIDLGVESLYNCLNSVLRLDNTILKTISYNARNLALSTFDIKITSRLHLKMYQSIFDNSILL